MIRQLTSVDDIAIWGEFFRQWPKGLAQRGVLVTTFDEQIAFVGFMLTSHTLLLERQMPDSVGARKVVLPLNKINAIKITDPVGAEVFRDAGFEGQISER